MASDYFGYSVVVTVDRIVVGAWGDTDNGTNTGAVYVYDANNLSAQPTKLTAFDGAGGDFFGISVAVTADKIIVGSRDDDNGESSGAVYVYDINNLSAQPTKLTAFDGAAGDQFGDRVFATADKIIVGAHGDDDNGSNSGSVYVYDANNLSAQPTKLTAFDGAASDIFGISVAVTADKIIVGATGDDDNGSSSGSVYVYDANNLSAQPTKLTAFDGAANDYFGISVAATADKIFVGALYDEDNGSDSGSVYVYDANNLSAQPTKLTAFDGAASDYFGSSVAVTDDKIFVGAYFDDDNGSASGSVYVYDVNNLSAQPTKLTAFDGAANDYFGNSVATISGTPSQLNDTTVSQSDNVFTVTPGQQDADFQLTFKATDTAGNVTTVPATFSLDYVNQAPAVSGIQSAYVLTQGQDAVITAVGTDPEGDAITWSFEESGLRSGYVIVSARNDDDNGSQSGSVYVYDANNLSATPIKLTAFDGAAGDYFGDSIAATTDKIIVGAFGDESNTGSVYVYDVNNLSAQPTKLTAFDGDANDYFGTSVVATNDKIIVGAYNDDDNGSNSGSVYVYDANNLSAQPTKLTAFDGAAGDYFGRSVAATNDKIIVGAYNDDDNGTNSGSAYVFDANNLSAQPTKLTAFDGAANDWFGRSVSVTADKIIVGAYGDDSITGAVYVYNANNLSAQPTKLTAFDGAAGDYFGYSVAAADDKILVGATGDDDNGSASGSVYVYDANNLSAQPTKLTAFDGASIDQFGDFIVATSDKIVVGASGDDDNGSNSGSVYVYDANNLSVTPTKLTAFDGAESDFFGWSFAVISAPSQLNDTTVSQSDNVFTVTPGQQDADFQLTFKATDTAGNVTSVPAEFSYDYVNNAPIVSGIQSAYTLIQGQDAVITAVGTDPEGDAITWSYEVVSSTSQDQLFVSAVGNNSYQGSVYVYNPTDLAQEPTLLTAPNGSSSERFGFSMEIDSDKIYIGELTSDESGETMGGAVYIYDRSDLSAAPTMLLAPSGEAQNNLRFGSDIFVNDNLLIIGAYGWGPTTNSNDDYTGKVYIYNKSDLSLQATLTPTNGDHRDYFGHINSVAVTPNHILLGAFGDDDNSTDAGAVYVYDVNTYAFVQKLTAPDASESHRFGGYSIKTYDGKVYISATGADHNGDDINAGAVYVYNESDLSFVEKLVAFDAAEGNYFGVSVLPHEDKLFVGASSRNSNTGGVYVYNIDNLSATPTVLESPVVDSIRMGYTTNIIDDKLYVSAHAANDFDGGVYVYSLSDLSATPTLISPPTAEGDRTTFGYLIFGSAAHNPLNGTTVSQSDNVFTVTTGQQDADFQLKFKATDTAGNTTTTTSDFTVVDVITRILVGASNAYGNESYTGAVYAYYANNLSATPTKLIAFDGARGDNFGDLVLVTSDKIIVGAGGDDGKGSVYVYDANNLSATPTKLTAFDGVENDRFGHSIAATDDKIFVGAYLDDDNGTNSGSVYVYDINNLSATPTKLTAFDGAANDWFGRSIATTADKIIVGAVNDDTFAGSVYVYDANNLSATPTKLTAFDGASYDQFGRSVAATSNKIVVNSYADESNAGSVYVYDANNLSATPTKLTAFDGARYDYFGEKSIAVTDDKIIVSAWGDDDNGSNSGSVYVYDANNLSATPTKLTAFDGAEGDSFGSSVAATADKVFVGALYDDDNGENSGSVYVYDANNLSATPTKLTAFDGVASGSFGSSIAVE